MQNLRQIAQRRILVVGTFDEVAALLHVELIAAFFAAPAPGFTIGLKFQDHVLPEKRGVTGDFTASLARQLPGTAAIPAGRELLSGRQQVAEVDDRGKISLENHRMRVIPNPFRAESPERTATESDFPAVGLVGGTDGKSSGLFLRPAAEIAVVMVLVGSKLEFRHLRKCRMQDLQIDHGPELQFQMSNCILQIHVQTPFL